MRVGVMGMVVRMCMPMISLVAVFVSVIISFSGACADTFYMMMVAFLNEANLIFKPEGLLAIFTEAAIHIVGPVENFLNPFCETIQN